MLVSWSFPPFLTTWKTLGCLPESSVMMVLRSSWTAFLLEPSCAHRFQITGASCFVTDLTILGKSSSYNTPEVVWEMSAITTDSIPSVGHRGFLHQAM